MSIKGTAKKAAGFIKEEAGEMLGSCQTAQEGRRDNGEPQKRTPVGGGETCAPNKANKK